MALYRLKRHGRVNALVPVLQRARAKLPKKYCSRKKANEDQQHAETKLFIHHTLSVSQILENVADEPLRSYNRDVTIQEAQDILREYTKSPNLIKHAQAVSAVMRFYAEKFREDQEWWSITGLLHDFDYEVHPTLEEHPQKGSAILRERGVHEEIVRAILSHAPHTGEPRDTLMKKTLFAADELSGFIVAVALVQPDKKLASVQVESVLKKLKVPSFAAKVNREEIRQGAQELGVALHEHVRNILTALQGVHGELGL